MKKAVLFFLLIVLPISFCLAQSSFANENKPAYKKVSIYKKQPKLYKPSHVAIGEEAEFKLVADPGSKAYLAFSYGNTGITYKGMDLRLASDVEIAEAVIPPNGIYNFKLTIKNDKEMVDKYLYVEAFVSDNSNEYQKAVLMNGVGQEAQLNQIAIIKRDTGKGLFLGPSPIFNDVMMNQYDEDSGYDPVRNMEYSPDTPDYIKNMRAPQNVQ